MTAPRDYPRFRGAIACPAVSPSATDDPSISKPHHTLTQEKWPTPYWRAPESSTVQHRTHNGHKASGSPRHPPTSAHPPSAYRPRPPAWFTRHSRLKTYRPGNPNFQRVLREYPLTLTHKAKRCIRRIGAIGFRAIPTTTYRGPPWCPPSSLVLSMVRRKFSLLPSLAPT